VAPSSAICAVCVVHISVLLRWWDRRRHECVVRNWHRHPEAEGRWLCACHATWHASGALRLVGGCMRFSRLFRLFRRCRELKGAAGCRSPYARCLLWLRWSRQRRQHVRHPGQRLCPWWNRRSGLLLLPYDRHEVCSMRRDRRQHSCNCTAPPVTPCAGLVPASRCARRPEAGARHSPWDRNMPSLHTAND
jgi:hypothetical protein